MNLKKGSSGAAVAALQKSLGKLYTGKVDGLFGPKTEAAVVAFQTANKLKATGIVDPQTAKALGLEPAPAPAQPAPAPAWTFDKDGFLNVATKVPTPRAGGAIHTAGVVVHTTDCYPGTMPVILRSWAETMGEGQAAHFLVGRYPVKDPSAKYPDGGVAQMVSLYRNGQHAGGKRGHGWVLDGAGKKLHPNTLYAGIELDCAGRLVKQGDQFIHPDSGKPVPKDQVWLDERGKPWHAVTTYQLEQLGMLLDAIGPLLADMPAGAKLLPNGGYVANAVPWAQLKGLELVGHATLDPANKMDPGPQVMGWMRQRYRLE